MKEAGDVAAFLRSPTGKWVIAGTTLGWCHAPNLSGAVVWGRPGAQQAREATLLFDAFRHPGMAARTVLILDARHLEVDMEALQVLAGWLRANRQELKARVQLQVGIVGGGTSALLVSGILPLLGDHHPFKVFTDAKAAYLHGAPEAGAALHDELEQLVGAARQQAPEVLALHTLLRRCSGNVEMAQAARQLGMSARTLQRTLTAAGTSFREIQAESRFGAAAEMLARTDLKVAAVASRLGISEGALAALMQSRAGASPAEYRRRERARE